MEQITDFLNDLGFNNPNAPLLEIVFALALSFLLNLLIATVYRRTFRGGDFSQEYVHTQLMLGMTVSVVVMVVHVDKHSGDAQATAFGVFAAFSLIRFRTTLGQPRDIGFLFLAMASGLGVGARAYWLATATTILLCAIIYMLSRTDAFAPSRASHRLRVRVTNDVDADTAFRECFAKYLLDWDLLSVESIQAGMMTELSYLVHIRDVSKPGEFVAALQLLNANNRVLLSSTIPNRALAD